MNTEQARKQLGEFFHELESRDHDLQHDGDWERAGSIIEQAAKLAAQLGLSELFRQGQRGSEYADITDAKQYVANMLAALKPTSELPLVLTDNDVANLLCCSRRTVWRWASSGEIPAPISLGGKKVWRRKDIENLIG